jgi:hypothetical protein
VRAEEVQKRADAAFGKLLETLMEARPDKVRAVSGRSF